MGLSHIEKIDLTEQQPWFFIGKPVLNYTLKQLRYVEAAGRLGSITKAATELSISQSSITAAIDAVEGGLGYDMFIRTPARGILPTPQGAEALAMIRGFIQQSRHFEAEMVAVAGGLSGSVRVACYATAAPTVLPPILSGVTANFPDMTFSIFEGSIERVMEYLDKGEADLAFSYLAYTEPRHAFEPLFDAPPFAIVPRKDPLARKSIVTLADLAERPFIMLDLPGARDYFADLFASAGLNPRIGHSTRSSEILRALVGIGFGVSLLNIRPLGYHETDSDYAIVPIKDAIAPPTFGIVTMKGLKPPQVVKAFVDSCIAMKKRREFDALVSKTPPRSTTK